MCARTGLGWPNPEVWSLIYYLFAPKIVFFAALQVKPPPRPKRGRPSVKSPLNPVPRASFKGALRKGRVDRCVSRPERESILCAVVRTQSNALVCPLSHCGIAPRVPFRRV